VGDFLIVSALLTSIVSAIVGFFALDRSKRGAIGALLGLLLGPIGVATAWGLRLKALREADEESERQRKLPMSASAPASLIDELERLALLKERGHLTDEEFKSRKRQLFAIALSDGTPSPDRAQR